MTIDKKTARESSRKSSLTTSPVKDRIIKFLERNKGQHSVERITREVKANIGHVRRCCRELKEKALILCEDLKTSKMYYVIHLGDIDPWDRYQDKNVEYTKTHALTFTVPYDLARQRELGMGIGTTFKYNTMYYHKWGASRWVSWKYGRNGILTVYLRNSKNPLDFEAFKHYITWLEGWFRIPLWTDLDNWSVCQYGLNEDIYTLTTNEQITLSAFGHFIAQLYNKKLFDGTPIQRNEIHGNEPTTGKEFIDAFQHKTNSIVLQRFAKTTAHQIQQQSEQLYSLQTALEHLIHELPGILTSAIKTLAIGSSPASEEGPHKLDHLSSPFT